MNLLQGSFVGIRLNKPLINSVYYFPIIYFVDKGEDYIQIIRCLGESGASWNTGSDETWLYFQQYATYGVADTTAHPRSTTSFVNGVWAANGR